MEKLRELRVWSLVFLSILVINIHSQPLLDDDHERYAYFYHDLKIEGLKYLLNDTEALLKETQLKLNEEQKEKESIYDLYNFLLRMYTTGIVTNDTTIDGICARNPRFITKTSDECHTYYNCSGVDHEISYWVEQYHLWPSIYKHECHYPFVFSDKTLKCENYTDVNCGTRHLSNWQCDYFRLKCKLGKCRPCVEVYPLCKNKTDGIWPLPDKPYDLFYMRCENERKIESGRCPYDSIWKVQSFPYNGQCVQLFALPREHHIYGELPSCKDEEDGIYQYLVGYCHGYYVCANGEATAVKCPNYTIFDTPSKSCAVDGNCIH